MLPRYPKTVSIFYRESNKSCVWCTFNHSPKVDGVFSQVNAGKNVAQDKMEKKKKTINRHSTP
jgi:hypothetical protein